MFLRIVVKAFGGIGRNASWISPLSRHHRVLLDSSVSSNKQYRTFTSGMKVTLCGAAGCTGQPLALLLKQCPAIDELALYDQCTTCGFGMELSHVDTKCKVSSYSGPHMLCDALKDTTVVVVVARNGCDTFEANAPVVTEIALHISDICPEAFTIIATEPVESLVPLVGEIFRLRNVYNPRGLLGCVELNCVRANTVLADFLRVPPETVTVPVIGGATPQTMVPVLSAACHPCIMSQEQVECITSCIMNGNKAVREAKGCCTATPCLAGAFAIARVTINVVKAIQGAKITQCAYVDSLETCAPDIQFFCSDVTLGPLGIEAVLGVPDLTKFENCLLSNSLPYVRNEQARAVWLVYSMCNYCNCSRCYVHPCTCYSKPCAQCVPPSVKCVAPCKWTGDCYSDPCVDEYLASICRDMTCRCCGCTGLCWRPRDCDFDWSRVGSLPHQIPQMGGICPEGPPPNSIRLEQINMEKKKSNS